MHFSDIQISNYKSYRESSRLDLAKGINIIVGKNNVGKTALLEALSLKFNANPHRTIETAPFPSRMLRQQSSVTFTFTVTKHELTNLLIAAQNDAEFFLPVLNLESPLAQKLKLEKNYSIEAAKTFGAWFFSHDSYTFRIRREAYGQFPAENWYIDSNPYISPHFEPNWENNTAVNYGKFRVDPIERTFSFFDSIAVSGGYLDFIVRISRFLNSYIYRFHAERIASSPCHLGMQQTLASDAGNLAEVLSLLNHAQLEEYNRLVREVLPEISQVNVRRLDDNKGEVIVWNDQNAVSRNDLAFNLAASGSGVSQVLAILYVVLTAREPQVIILDEPQGFLHPDAARKLTEALRHYTKYRHQLIIATHSPTVITASDPTSVTMIKQEGTESTFERIDIKEAAEQRKYLGDVGARLSDVFGYDRILWVEGKTEERCFPMILRELTAEGLMGTAILRVQHTGDFNRRDTKNVFEIYERLSQLEGGLVPPVVGFIFDRETRSERQLEDLKRESRGRIHFTGKRLFENYLLNPRAITAVLNHSEITTTESAVVNWLEQNKTNSKYYKPSKFSSDDSWTENVDGALLLHDLFADLTSKQVAFDKTEHSPMLTEWLLKNSPEDLRELSDLLKDVLTINASI